MAHILISAAFLAIIIVATRSIAHDLTRPRRPVTA